MKLSFVVVTYQRHEMLRVCLDSILSQQDLPNPYEIIIVDNGSDPTLEPPSRDGVQVKVTQPEKNLGVTGGRNLGVQLASGEYLIFIDDDAVWHDSQDAARLIRHLEADSTCGAVAVKSLHPETHQIIDRNLPHPNKHRLKATPEPIPVPHYYGVAHALRADVFRQVGAYPERYFYAMEEVDLSLRMIDAGYHVIYDPDIAVFHHKTSSGRPVQGNSYWFMNALNKSRMGFRLLPYPYPLTILLVWSLRTLYKTRNPVLMLRIWRDLWRERDLLRSERKPIRPETIRYLKNIGASLWY